MAHKILRQLRRYSKNSDVTWRYTFNLAPTIAYKLGGQAPSGEAARVLGDLNRDGIAITSARALLGQDSCFDVLSAAVDKLEGEMADQIAVARAAVNDPRTTTQKSFLFELLGKHPALDSNDVYARFALQEPLLHIANGYFGMYVRLRYCNIWHNFAIDKQASQSQLWHRDPEDRYILKVFVCLVDVDDGTGPFTYAAGSHPKGNLRREPAYLHKDGNTTRSDDSQMAEVVPPERWVKGVGPKGTIILADTRGYHKGGLARDRDRILYACEYTSLASGGGGLSTRLPANSVMN